MHLSHSTSIWLACLSSLVSAPLDAHASPRPDVSTYAVRIEAPQASASASNALGSAPGTAYCAGDGLDPQVTAQCQGGNVGLSGRGCNNFDPTLGGALLTASGATSPNTLEFTCTGLPSGSSVIFVRSTASVPAGFRVGIGVSCISGTLVRFGFQTSGNAGPFTSSAVAATVAPGSTRHYQVLYRVAVTGDYNASNAYAISW